MTLFHATAPAKDPTPHISMLLRSEGAVRKTWLLTVPLPGDNNEGGVVVELRLASGTAGFRFMNWSSTDRLVKLRVPLADPGITVVSRWRA